MSNRTKKQHRGANRKGKVFLFLFEKENLREGNNHDRTNDNLTINNDCFILDSMHTYARKNSKRSVCAFNPRTGREGRLTEDGTLRNVDDGSTVEGSKDTSV